jgi:hypothetical protein
MMTRTVKGKILVFSVFLVGVATGALLSNFYETRVSGRRPEVAVRDNRGNDEERARREVNAMHDYLGLDQTQREQIQKILEETRSEFRSLRAETRPRFEAISERSRNKIRAVLKEEQLQKYDEYRRDRSRQRNNK